MITIDIPEADLQNVTNILSHSWANGALETYGSGLLIFHCFCKTLEGFLSGICAWHLLHGVPWAPNKSNAMLSSASVYCQDHCSVANTPRPGYPLDATVGLCLTTGYYLCTWLGELTIKTLTSFSPSIHVKPSNVHEGTDPSGLAMTALGIPITKSKRSSEDIFYAAQNNSTDPCRVFENHLCVNAPPPNSHLFSYKHKHSHLLLTKTVFITQIHKAFKTTKLEPLQGHSIHIGAMLFYLLRGTPFDVVKTISRWASNAFLLYLR
ncbi:hypothetical protein B0H10DRAFT_2164803 [Mycena sp. CBHHK59/15]|nr:hypothetical protein B0H10DRAFT_2164803 [Mycena sp. CBHHK59/15]